MFPPAAEAEEEFAKRNKFEGISPLRLLIVIFPPLVRTSSEPVEVKFAASIVTFPPWVTMVLGFVTMKLPTPF